MLDFGIIGLGKMGLLHTALVNAYSGARVVGVVDKDNRLARILSRYNRDIADYTSVEELANNHRLDGIVIATPANAHLSAFADFAPRFPRAFVEKPLELNCSRIASFQFPEEARHNVCVGYVMRFHPTFNRARRLLQKGIVGEISSFQASYYIESVTKKLKGWRADPDVAGGGALITNASHIVDLIVWYFGQPVSVNGLKQHHFHDSVEDAFYGLLRYSSGMVGTIGTSWMRKNFRKPYMRLEIVGTTGEIDVDNDAVRLKLFEDRDGWQKGVHVQDLPSLAKGCFFDIGGPEFSRQAEAFLQFAKTNGRGDLCSFEEAFAGHRVMDALYQSADSHGAPVSIGDEQ